MEIGLSTFNPEDNFQDELRSALQQINERLNRLQYQVSKIETGENDLHILNSTQLGPFLYSPKKSATEQSFSTLPLVTKRQNTVNNLRKTDAPPTPNRSQPLKRKSTITIPQYNAKVLYHLNDKSKLDKSVDCGKRGHMLLNDARKRSVGSYHHRQLESSMMENNISLHYTPMRPKKLMLKVSPLIQRSVVQPSPLVLRNRNPLMSRF